jgi:hypothetical protein
MDHLLHCRIAGLFPLAPHKDVSASPHVAKTSRIPVKATISRRLAAVLLPGALCFPTLCPAQTITDLNLTTDPDSLLKSLEITVDVPPLSMVRMQGNPSLAGPGWDDLTGDTSAFIGGETTFAAPVAGPRGFFRFQTTSIPFSGSSDGVSFQFKLGPGITLPLFTDLMRSQTKWPVFPQVMDTGLYRELDGLTLPPGEHSVPNPSMLGDALGLGLWVPGRAEDDGKFAETYRPTDFPQDGKEIPTPGGDRPMEPWQDEVRVEVPPGQIVEPGAFDMVFKPEIEDVDGRLPLDDEGIVFPGKEARVFLRLLKDGSYNIDSAAMSEGAGPADAFPPLPPPGSLVLVAYAPDKQGILHLRTLADPFAERSYDPPDGGSHGVAETEMTSVHLIVPLPNGDPDRDLPGVVVRVFRYAREIDQEYGGPDSQPALTPEFFERHRPLHFDQLLEVEGGQIAEALKPRRAPKDSSKDPTVTELRRAGSNGSKINIAILGDGFQDNAADQDLYNDYVNNIIMEDFLNRDMHPEILNALNIFRVNTYSVDSGVTQVNSSGTVTTARSTALEYRYSGVWARCWMEGGPNSGTLIAETLADVCPQADIVFLVLNETSGGGCKSGNRFTVTLSSSWSTVSHEFGHLFGKLGDEYGCNASSCSPLYTGDEPGNVNLTKVTNRNNVKWKQWIPSWRPVLTLASHVADSAQDVGIFQGAVINNTRWADGIFRPTLDGRMRSNSLLHNPVGHTMMRDEARPSQEATFRKNVTGDFNGDGRDDLVLLDGRQLSLYLAGDRNPGPDDPQTGDPPRAVNGVLKKTWFFTDRLRSDGGSWSWQIRPGDKLYPGDFDGDGDDDLYVFNGSDWNQPYLAMLRSEGDRFQPVRRYDSNLPGWEMRAGDTHHVADFNDDGRDDLFIYNGKNWSIPYLVMLRANPTSLTYVRRYDRYLPGTWEMGKNERFFVGDYDGDGKESLIAQDRDSWSQVHLRVYNINSTSSGLVQASRHYGPIAGDNFTWNMHRKDELHVGDFDADGAADLALFNGLNWNGAYLGLFQSDKGSLVLRRTYSNAAGFTPLPGWGLQRKDRFWVADVDGDNDSDLIVYNTENWDSQYLGTLRSNGSFSLAGSWQKDWIGGWNLGGADDFRVADFRGGAGWDDLFVFNKDWFGLLRSQQTAFQLESINHKWITQHRYHGWGFW